MSAEHFEDNVFCADPRLQFTDKFNTPDQWHRDVKRFTGHREGHFDATRSDRQHPNCPSSRCVAVGTKQGFAWNTKTLLVYGMTDSISCSTEPNTETRTGGLEIQVIIRVLIVLLYKVVVHILDREFGLDSIKPHSFEFEHDHRARSVLRQRLIHSDADFRAR